jgi:hypothetical protein
VVSELLHCKWSTARTSGLTGDVFMRVSDCWRGGEHHGASSDPPPPWLVARTRRCRRPLSWSSGHASLCVYTYVANGVMPCCAGTVSTD